MALIGRQEFTLVRNVKVMFSFSLIPLGFTWTPSILATEPTVSHIAHVSSSFCRCEIQFYVDTLGNLPVAPYDYTDEAENTSTGRARERAIARRR